MRYAVIPTHNKPKCLAECLKSLAGQVQIAIVIDNASEPPVEIPEIPNLGVVIIKDDEQPPNLSRLWNVGIQAANFLEGYNPQDPDYCPDEAGFWIAIVNDDVIVPSGWMDLVVGAMKDTEASAGCVDPFNTVGPARLYTSQINSVYTRMIGWAFVLDGVDGIRADERLRWWYGDTAIDANARTQGGTVLVPGPEVINRHANASTTGILAEQAGKDRASFEAYYHRVPW